MENTKTGLKFFDIAANLADDKFKGKYYNNKKYHQPDLDAVIERANQYGVDKMLVVGGYIEDTEECVEIIEGRENWWTTVGVHPCRANVCISKSKNCPRKEFQKFF